MGFSHFFIDRPIFAGVISVILTLVGAIAFRALPISEFPDIAPPTVSVRATFAGASAEVIANTVAAPIEQEINGVDNMLYVVSQSTGNGALEIQVVFKPGTNIDQAQVLVQNRVSIALPRLPEEVQRFGVTVRKRAPDLLLVIHMISPDGRLDQQYISNYATINIKDVLTRLDGVGDTTVFGARDYSMRVWLDPAKVQARGLTAAEVVMALRAANVQVAAGAINQPPATSPGAFEVAVQTLGRLSSPDQFSEIVVATDPDGRVTRVRDIARVELGSQDYTSNAYLNNQVATAIGIFQRPGSNALTTAAGVIAKMDELSKDFPAGLGYRIAYNTTQFIQESVNEVIRTLFEAAALVVLVIILFLQSWRAAIIPIVAIPVSLVGTFFVMQAFGFSLNNLTLFGLVLAIGIVVDDAIVVVENVERYLRQGLSPREAAHKTMDEVGGALVAIALVLCAVFIPTAFITGISGEFYRQFAISIAASTVISAIVSLTLSPALAALLLRGHGHDQRSRFWKAVSRPIDSFFAGFNRMFERLSLGYAGLTRRALRVSVLVLVVYGGLIGLTYLQFARAPSGFIPSLDRAYFITAITLPPGSSLERTDMAVRKASEILLSRPGVANAVAFAGFDGATFTNAPNSGVVFVTLKPFEERVKAKLSTAGILNDLRSQMQALRGAFVLVIPPPSVPGIGTGGGFKLYVQDRAGRGPRPLEQAVGGIIGPANQTPGLVQVFTLFNTATPQVYADIDRTKAEMLGVPITRFFETLSTYMGSTFVNDFNILGRTYRVTAQADNPFRLSTRDVENLRTRSTSGDMVPLGSVATFSDVTAPYRVPRYNLVSRRRSAGRDAARFLDRSGDRGDGEDRRGKPAGRIRFRMDGNRPAGKGRRQYRDHRIHAGGRVRFSAAGRAVRKLVAAARRDPDRADVPVRRHQRRAVARHGQQYSHPDRFRRIDRPRCQERHPDRRVRQAGRGAGPPKSRRGRASGTNASAADPDDVIRLHLRRGAAGACHGSGRGDATGAWYSGILWHARRDAVRTSVHAGVLHGRASNRDARQLKGR